MTFTEAYRKIGKTRYIEAVPNSEYKDGDNWKRTYEIDGMPGWYTENEVIEIAKGL